ncbi:uncharacterized protein LOC119630598 [Bombyx mori]|uniref:Uncharacterized protein n=1 Tax=Bombyx mori TaxID=7091 RepID=A0A8R2R4H3_BOMMO|nr:uncharacterized protein LOC119630598 [Bombyx mori]
MQDTIMHDSTSAANKAAVAVFTKGRKRTRQPENWKQTKSKILRNSGKSYINSKNTITKARQLKPPCKDTCRLRCFTKINSVQRQNIFDTYWGIGDIHNQRSFIWSCLTNIEPKYKYTNALAPRNCNKAFHFIVNGNPIRVCKVFFLNILDISDRVVRTVRSKTDEHGVLKTDFRGMTCNRKSDEVLISDIKEFINSIPRTDSHYRRQSSIREYIDGSKTIVDLFRDFEEVQNKKISLLENLMIKVTKNNPFSFFIKESYKQQNFSEVYVRNRRTKMLPLNQLTLVKAYTGKQELSENKKKIYAS